MIGVRPGSSGLGARMRLDSCLGRSRRRGSEDRLTHTGRALGCAERLLLTRPGAGFSDPYPMLTCAAPDAGVQAATARLLL